MEELNKAFFSLKNDIATIQSGIHQTFDWYKKEMDNLRAIIKQKDYEIFNIKKELNERFSK